MRRDRAGEGECPETDPSGDPLAFSGEELKHGAEIAFVREPDRSVEFEVTADEDGQTVNYKSGETDVSVRQDFYGKTACPDKE